MDLTTRFHLTNQRLRCSIDRHQQVLLASWLSPDAAYRGHEQKALRRELADLRALHTELHELAIKVFDPAQPRIPAGQDGAGQWTDGHSGSIREQAPDSSPVLVAIGAAGIGHNQGPSLEPPPDIPEEPPSSRPALTSFAKQAARWLVRAARFTGPYGLAFSLGLEAAFWLAGELPSILSYQDPPKTLGELQQAVSDPQPGYDIHHIVEQKAARNAGFPEEMINGSQNLVRIPRYSHHEITGWYQRGNDDFGTLSPRQFLEGKTWDERYQMGIRSLIEKGALKP